jgi:hypothetical protein
VSWWGSVDGQAHGGELRQRWAIGGHAFGERRVSANLAAPVTVSPVGWRSYTPPRQQRHYKKTVLESTSGFDFFLVYSCTPPGHGWNEDAMYGHQMGSKQGLCCLQDRTGCILVVSVMGALGSSVRPPKGCGCASGGATWPSHIVPSPGGVPRRKP